MLSTGSPFTPTSPGLSKPQKVTLYIIAGVAAVLIILGAIIGIFRSRCRDAYNPAQVRSRKSIPLVQYNNEPDSHPQNTSIANPDGRVSIPVGSSVCPICTEDFLRNQVLRVLPCCHQYHLECIQRRLDRGSGCPVCRVDSQKKLCMKDVSVSDLERGLPSYESRNT